MQNKGFFFFQDENAICQNVTDDEIASSCPVSS